jgi:hypothetical protein
MSIVVCRRIGHDAIENRPTGKHRAVKRGPRAVAHMQIVSEKAINRVRIETMHLRVTQMMGCGRGESCACQQGRICSQG